MDFALLFKAIGLVFILEGALYFLFAERMHSMLQTLLEWPPASLRKLGFIALLCGLLIIYATRWI